MSEWGEAAANKFVKFGNWLKQDGKLFHDDSVADFGGNDGYAANQFYLHHGIKPLVVDCEPKRIDHAMKVYRLSTYEAFLENMSDLESKSIDWGFTSHTMEHTRDPYKAASEIARVIKRGCYFVLPLEPRNHAKHNHAHVVSFLRLGQWKTLLRKSGWKIVLGQKCGAYECQIYAEPK